MGVTGGSSAPIRVAWLRLFFPLDDTHPNWQWIYVDFGLANPQRVQIVFLTTFRAGVCHTLAGKKALPLLYDWCIPTASSTL
ncbi:hypothetical protein Y032_0091g2457 [Ancylostoma ceylanicum]|uniref:Uncharacterized protein n=1 Tax=Ancylostoma ceylanicum TaxID=53326 RepID=A0A016TMG5_9BILA|nr:hypothetical protein Y032_0091g2457 [Ancylostoma ceylanicum]